MDYWNEVKRIRDIMMANLGIGIAEASEIIDGITGKLGYFFRLDNNISHAVKREEVFGMLAELEKSGKEPEMVAMLKSHYAGQTGEYVTAEPVTEAEAAQNATALEQVIRQLEQEAAEEVRRRKGTNSTVPEA